MITPQERDLLTQFLNQLKAAPAPQKESEADSLIREAIAQQPDAAYLLVQRSLLLEQALDGAKAQIAELQAQVQAVQSGQNRGFLGNNPWAGPANTANSTNSVPGSGQYQIPRFQQAYGGAQGSTGGGAGFLGNIASTAAGVVAGSFLFQGIENLLGHHTGGGFPGNGDYPQHAGGDTIINNYYETPPDDTWARSDGDNDFLASDNDVTPDDGDDTTWT
ncbi:DUF2076 domain-containing protein [Methylococcus sp. EFPC2]|uniref:DUF2076 domain-containing protein n=1 Tax=Methylococcus sp. EFPC2 TaxID=2812648 RepID=UPI001967A400|nr:DUF2076 domain-containing protein [Methylococcus sp. EFPC2]QSA98229.1 DUF2076 domain-containing protein [Methylococcus sp. EFPC2]